MARFRYLLSCGHEQGSDLELDVGDIRVCRLHPDDPEMRPEITDRITANGRDAEDHRYTATRTVEELLIQGRAEIRSMIQQWPEGMRHHAARLVLRSLLVELEELPETILGDPQ
jgi:hypothetical protein